MFTQSSDKYPLLFSPAALGRLTVPNRIVMAPMATNFASAGGEVTEWLIDYYCERARGGVGLIIIENSNVDFPKGLSGTTQLRIDEDRFVPGLYRLTRAIHMEGGLCALQINHAGAIAKKVIEMGVQPVAPSHAPDGLYSNPHRLLQPEEIDDIIRRFSRAAYRAQQAGFDAVEIHGAHAYLIAQFLSPLTNQRHDHYGGSTENRARFAINIIKETRKLVGPDYPVLFRMNVSDFLAGGLDPDEADAVASMLVQSGVDALDFSVGTNYKVNRSLCSLIEPMSYVPGWRLDLISRIKSHFVCPIIAVGPFRYPLEAEEALQEGKVDLVSLGRPLIADPFWPKKARIGKEQQIRICISCNEGCVRPRLFENQPIGCAVNPEVGSEGVIYKNPNASRKMILVVGGGPAGCTAALYACQRGHGVVLIEQRSDLGGNCLVGSRLLHKKNLAAVIDYHRTKLEQLNVEVYLKTVLSPELLEKLKPEVLVWAAGAEPFIPNDIEIQDAKVLFPEDAISRGMPWNNKLVAVIGGGTIGCELSLTLSNQDNQVLVFEALNNAARDLEPISRFDLLDRVEKDSKVQLMFGTRVIRVIKKEIEYQDKKRGTQRKKVDQIIWATGYRPRSMPNVYLERFPGLKIFRIGDSLHPRNVFHAVKDGFAVGVGI